VFAIKDLREGKQDRRAERRRRNERGSYVHCVKTVFNRRIAPRQALKNCDPLFNRFLFRGLADSAEQSPKPTPEREPALPVPFCNTLTFQRFSLTLR
jgi:hypothetical protein